MPPFPVRIRVLLPVAFVLFCIAVVAFVQLLVPNTTLHAQDNNTFLPIVGGSGATSSTPVATPTRTPAPGATTTPTPGAPATSSLALIHDAETSGAITHEEALLYSVYALFADARLPAQFKGAASHDSMVMAQIRNEWADLSSATQQALAPFLLPPTAAESWLAQREAATAANGDAIVWRNVTSTHNVRVWYQTRYAGDDVKAAQVRDAIDQRIYAVMQAVMGKEWLPDGGHTDNGGDNMLDIYLVRGVGYWGLATPYAGCKQTAAWLNLDSNRAIGDETSDGIIQTAAHEMMHAVQYVYPLKDDCSTYDWLSEATAKWFEHQVYPQANSEHPYAPDYLATAHLSLEDTTRDRGYGAYLYFFYVSESEGKPAIVRRAWENAATMDSLSAVDQGGASFSTYWGDFAVANWNPDANAFYWKYDDLQEHAIPHGDTVYASPDDGLVVYPLPAQLPHLSMQYFVFDFSDEETRSVTFVNGFTAEMTEQSDWFYSEDKYFQGELLPLDQRRNVEVRALYRVEGDAEWKSGDWTNDTTVGFCRDVAGERLEDLILIVANGEHESSSPSYTYSAPAGGAALVVSDTGCWRWKGSLQVTSADDSWDEFLIDVPEIVLESSDDWADAYRLFKVIGGHGTIALHDYSDDGCDGEEVFTEGPQPFTLSPNRVADWSYLTLPVAVTGGPRMRALSGVIVSDATYKYVWLCETDAEHPGRERHEHETQVGDLLRLPSLMGEDFETFADGAVLQGSVVVDNFRYTYHLEAQSATSP